MRYLRDGNGTVVGAWDRANNRLILLPGASADMVAHELGGHAVYQFAQQLAEQGDSTLLDKLNAAIATAPEAVWNEVDSKYPDASMEVRGEEVLAHVMGRKGSEAIENVLATREGQNWYQKVWQAIKDVLRGIASKMGFNRADLSEIDGLSGEETLDWIVRQMVGGKTLGTVQREVGGGRRNAAAMAKFSSGRNYVHVDADQDLFNGKPISQMPKIARRVILDKFKGKVIGDAPQNAYVKRRTAEEFAYAGKPLDNVAKEAKMRSSAELDNILRAGEFINHEPDDGSHPEATGGWDYYETVFQVGDKLFSGTINIMNTKNGRVFYDVTDVKENTQGLRTQYGIPQGSFPGYSMRQSISNPATENNPISEKDDAAYLDCRLQK